MEALPCPQMRGTWGTRPSCPMGLDLDGSFDSCLVVQEAGPGPFFRLVNQSTLDWIAVHVAELLYSLLFRPDVEVVVPPLPELSFAARLQLPRSLLLQHLDCNRQ